MSYFKETITHLTGKTGLTDLTGKTNYIDYNPQIIDTYFSDLEDFYSVVHKRDKAIVSNALKKMQELKETSSILIVGGFHTKGMTTLLRDNQISYIVLSANSNTEMDDELYHNLLSGKRPSFEDLIAFSNELLNESLRTEGMLFQVGNPGVFLTGVLDFTKALALVGSSISKDPAGFINELITTISQSSDRLQGFGCSSEELITAIKKEVQVTYFIRDHQGLDLVVLDIQLLSGATKTLCISIKKQGKIEIIDPKVFNEAKLQAGNNQFEKAHTKAVPLTQELFETLEIRQWPGKIMLGEKPITLQELKEWIQLANVRFSEDGNILNIYTDPTKMGGEISISVYKERSRNISEDNVVFNDLWARPSAGVFCPFEALAKSTRWGIGNIGEAAEDFIDYLAKHEQSQWLIFPIHETCALFGEPPDPSPYNALSAKAKNPLLIDPDRVYDVIRSEKAQAKIDEYEKGGVFKKLSSQKRIDYRECAQYIFPIFQLGFMRFKEEELDKGTERDMAFKDFLERKKKWIYNYRLFRALAEYYNTPDWREWEEKGLVMREPAILKAWEAKLKDRILFWIYLQFIFDEQWSKLRNYAHKKNVLIKGDKPFYVSVASDAAWVEKDEVFDLDPNKNYAIITVGGAEPDMFSSTGQKWGNPTFSVKEKKQKVFEWILSCLEEEAEYLDGVRLDHVRAYSEYWEIPFGGLAMDGHYEAGPGVELLGLILNRIAYPSLIQIFGENLGYSLKNINEVLDRLGMFGYKIFRFSLDSNEYPEDYTFENVAYLFTHDTSTDAKWWEKELTLQQRQKIMTYAFGSGRENDPNISVWDWDKLKAISRRIYSSKAGQVITSIQSTYKLGEGNEINFPGKGPGEGAELWNWKTPFTIKELNGDFAGSKLNQEDRDTIEKGNEMLLRLTRESGRGIRTGAGVKKPGVHILKTLPDVTKGVEEIVQVDESFVVWACIEGEPKEVRLWTNLPENKEEIIEKRSIPMSLVAELPTGNSLYRIDNIKATKIGRYWFTVEANGELAGGYGQNGYLVVLPKDKENVPVWTFEYKDKEFIAEEGILIIQAKSPGIVHAGVRDEISRNWSRICDVPLKPVGAGIYEALLTDPEINAFTFRWPNGEWEKTPYYIKRTKLVPLFGEAPYFSQWLIHFIHLADILPDAVTKVDVALDRGNGDIDKYPLILPRLELLDTNQRRRALQYAVADIITMVVNEGAQTVAISGPSVQKTFEEALGWTWYGNITNRERLQFLGNKNRPIKVISMSEFEPSQKKEERGLSKQEFTTVVRNDTVMFITGESETGGKVDINNQPVECFLVSTGIGWKETPLTPAQLAKAGEGGHSILFPDAPELWHGASVEDNSSAIALVRGAAGNWKKAGLGIKDVLTDEVRNVLLENMKKVVDSKNQRGAELSLAEKIAKENDWEPNKVLQGWIEQNVSMEEIMNQPEYAVVVGMLAAKGYELGEKASEAQKLALGVVKQVAENLSGFVAFRHFRRQQMGRLPPVAVILAGGIAVKASSEKREKGYVKTGDILAEEMNRILEKKYGITIPVYGATLGDDAPLIGAAWAAKRAYEEQNPGKEIWQVAAFDGGGQSCRAAMVDLFLPIGKQVLGRAAVQTPQINSSARTLVDGIRDLFNQAYLKARETNPDFEPSAVGFSLAGPVDAIKNIPTGLTNFGEEVNSGIATVQNYLQNLAEGKEKIVSKPDDRIEVTKIIDKDASAGIPKRLSSIFDENISHKTLLAEDGIGKEKSATFIKTINALLQKAEIEKISVTVLAINETELVDLRDSIGQEVFNRFTQAGVEFSILEQDEMKYVNRAIKDAAANGDWDNLQIFEGGIKVFTVTDPKLIQAIRAGV